MLGGKELAITSSGVIGQTFKSDRYPMQIKEKLFNVFDTAGVGEGDEGKVPTRDAITNLYQLMNELEDGISLLVFLFRAQRLEDQAVRNYKMFHEIFCNRQVPIVIVVTGLENENNMEDWWSTNSTHFQRYKMEFEDHACITATRGKSTGSGWTLQKEYEESKEKIENLIVTSCRKTPWIMSKDHWFAFIVSRLLDSTTLGARNRHRRLLKALRKNAGMSTKAAQEYIQEIRGV
jgi:hypothetical protein